MDLALTPTSPADRAVIVDFLLTSFRLQPGAVFVEPALLDWKYFEPRPDWEGPRSYVLRHKGEIMAHGCVVPSRFHVGSGEVRGIRVIDWAGDRRFPGSGILLMRKFNEWSDIVMAVGGSQDTLRVLPKAGFKLRGSSAVYARVVRPWRQFRTDPFPRGWKAPLRLLRNSGWAVFSRTAPVVGDWSLRRVEQFDDSVAPILEFVPPGTAQPARSATLLNYMLRCPGAEIRGFLILEKATVRGYCLISQVGGQARIAELRVASNVASEWRTGYALAVEEAAADRATCEILAVATVPITAQALEANGFRFRRNDPVLVRDPHGRLEGIPLLNINMLEGDEAYVYNWNYPFET